MSVLTGLDRVLAEDLDRFKGKKIGLVCHQASIASDCQLVLDHFLKFHHLDELEIKSVFGPQHGIWGHTQDNMIEWEGYRDERTGLTFHSLYGKHREPTPPMLDEIDELVFDVQDVGARYYTFIWTLANCMKACEKAGIAVTVLDRPNPINGVDREGPGHEMEYASFVGLYSLPVRHGLTVGEVAMYLKKTQFPDCELDIVQMSGWERGMFFDETGLPWATPSPNMPTVETAVVYPGMCLFEGTKLSEGRGTTRPFETFGAPYIDGWKLADRLNSQNLPGVLFRPIQFLPTFQKFAGEICQGCFIHVIDRDKYQSVLTASVILKEIIDLWPDEFEFLDPPYEYEEVLMPFDILSGSDWLRNGLISGKSVQEINDQLGKTAESLINVMSEVEIY